MMRLLGLFLALLVLLAALLVALHPVPSASGAGGAASWSLLGRPSVSATFMDEVLAAYHSPAVGLGQALYADGIQTDIDPAYALAFFWHESRFGTQGVARFTHSLGNIRCSAGYACFDGFRAYATWAAGAADWFHLITSVYVPAGRTTVSAVVSLYAPPAENDTAAYVCAVESAVAAWRAGQLFVKEGC